MQIQKWRDVLASQRGSLQHSSDWEILLYANLALNLFIPVWKQKLPKKTCLSGFPSQEQ